MHHPCGQLALLLVLSSCICAQRCPFLFHHMLLDLLALSMDLPCSAFHRRVLV